MPYRDGTVVNRAHAEIGEPLDHEGFLAAEQGRADAAEAVGKPADPGDRGLERVEAPLLDGGGELCANAVRSNTNCAGALVVQSERSAIMGADQGASLSPTSASAYTVAMASCRSAAAQWLQACRAAA